MADPGSAVGIISLGIQVAQGLVKYYSSFSAYDVDIAHAIQRVERLYSTLAALEAPLSRLELSNDSISDRVRISLNSCRQELLNLEDVVKKCAEVSVPHTIPTRIQRVKTKALYPFRKSTLLDMEKWLHQAQVDLDAAVQILQLKFGIDFQDRIDNQLAHIANNQLNTINATNTMYAASHSNAQQYGIIISRVDQNIENLVAQQQQMAQQFQTLMQFTAAIADRRNLSPSVVTEGISLSQNLELSSKSSGRQEDPQMHEESDTVSASWFGARCSCTKTKSTKVRSILQDAISLRWQQDLHHESSCPRSYSHQRSGVVSVKIRSYSWVFNRILEATVSCTWGAGGYSIGQALAFHRLVSSRNPAFLLLQPHYFNGRSLDSPVNYNILEEVARKLDQYFRDGTISPTDVCDRFGTLLQAACDFIANDYPRYVRTPSTEEAMNFLRFLIRAGVPVSYTHSSLWHESALQWLLNSPWTKNVQGSQQLSSFLLDQGSTWSGIEMLSMVIPPPSFISHPQLFTTPLLEQGFAEDPLLSAIVRRSLSELNELLSTGQYPSSCPLKLDLRSEYISACIGWPRGMAAMLDFVCNKNLVVDRDFPFWHASCLQDWDSFDMLFQAGFRITYSEFREAVHQGGESLRHMIPKIIQQSDTLQHTSQGSQSTQLDINTIFHADLNLEAACILYDAGIRTLDIESSIESHMDPFSGTYVQGDTTTPLWKIAENILINLCRGYGFSLNRFEVSRWLIDKGARLAWVNPRFRTTPAHVLPAAFTCGINRSKFASQVFSVDSWWSFYSSIVTAVGKDSCCCACSKDGCLPIVSSFKASLYMTSKVPNRHRIEQVAQAIAELLLWMDTLLSSSLDMANAVLRILTFEKLGIRHTCHEMAIYRNSAYGGPCSDEDIEEFHAEDAELIARLQLLVPEFENAYASSNDPSFYNFCKGYWTSRMDEVIADMSVATEDYMSSVEQVGVRLRPLGPEPPTGIESTYWDGWPSSEDEDSLSESEEE